MQTKYLVAIIVAVITCIGTVLGSTLAATIGLFGPVVQQLVTQQMVTATATPTIISPSPTKSVPPSPIPSNTLPVPTTRPQPSIVPSPTFTAIPTKSPTATFAPTGVAIIQVPQLCTRSNTPCECEWKFGYARPNVIDTWSLGNSGTGILKITRFSSTCENCLRRVFPPDGTSIDPSKNTQLQIEYLVDKDPKVGVNHDYVISIHSNASNCPVLNINVPVQFK